MALQRDDRETASRRRSPGPRSQAAGTAAKIALGGSPDAISRLEGSRGPDGGVLRQADGGALNAMLEKFFDLDHPFFRPLWIRIATVAACLGWAALEIAAGAMVWAALFGGVGLYAAWRFFVTFNPREKP
jgi:hypothetical protein